MNMVLGAIDVRHQPVEHRVVIHYDLGRVAAQHGHLAQVLGEQDRLGELGGKPGVEDVRVVGEPFEHLTHGLWYSGNLLAPPAWQGRPADEQVKREADPRLEEDQQQPALGRRRGPPEWDDGQHDYPDGPLAEEEGPGPGRGEKPGHEVLELAIDEDEV